MDANGKTSLGLRPNIEALLCYLLGWITGLIFLLLERESRFVRFHAIQSAITFGALNAVFLIMFWISPLLLGMGLVVVIGISLGLWLVLMNKAYRGQWHKLPWVGDFAEKRALDRREKI